MSTLKIEAADGPIGAEITDLPATPEAVLRALQNKTKTIS